MTNHDVTQLPLLSSIETHENYKLTRPLLDSAPYLVRSNGGGACQCIAVNINPQKLSEDYTDFTG